MRSSVPQDSLPRRTKTASSLKHRTTCALTADPMRLKQILLNFLSEGEVALRVRKVADGRDWIELAVADTAASA